jgi:hypothetical protein
MSNKPFPGRGETSPDEVTATAMIDRLVHHSKILGDSTGCQRLVEKRWSSAGCSRHMRSTPSSSETQYVRRMPRESKYSITSPSPASGAPMTQIASGNGS